MNLKTKITDSKGKMTSSYRDVKSIGNSRVQTCTLPEENLEVGFNQHNL